MWVLSFASHSRKKRALFHEAKGGFTSSPLRVFRSFVLFISPYSLHYCVSPSLLCCIFQMQGKNEEFYRRLHQSKSTVCATCHTLWPLTTRPPAGQPYECDG